MEALASTNTQHHTQSQFYCAVKTVFLTDELKQSAMNYFSWGVNTHLNEIKHKCSLVVSKII